VGSALAENFIVRLEEVWDFPLRLDNVKHASKPEDFKESE
jgi:hypothetical protein